MLSKSCGVFSIMKERVKDLLYARVCNFSLFKYITVCRLYKRMEHSPSTGVPKLSSGYSLHLKKTTTIFYAETWFLLVSVLKNRCEDDSYLRIWKLYHHLSKICHVISQYPKKNIFRFTEIVNSHGMKRGTVCHIVRFIYLFL